MNTSPTPSIISRAFTKLLLFLAVSLCTGISANAEATFTSNGGTVLNPLDWNTPATWTISDRKKGNNLIPTLDDKVIILNNHNISISGPATADNVDISGSLVVNSLVSDLVQINSITKAGTTSGTLTVNSGNLRIEENFSLINLAVNINTTTSSITFGGQNPIIRSVPALPSEYIKLFNRGKLVLENLGKGGPLKRLDDVLFPIGTPSSYTPLVINNKDLTPTATALGNFSVTVSDGVYQNGADGLQVGNAVNKSWEIVLLGTTNTGVTPTSNATITFQWNNVDELSDFTLETATLFGYTTNWTPIAGSNSTLNQTARTISIVGLNGTGLTYFPKYSVMDGPMTPLPVELISFNAVKQNNEVALTWETASEKNCKGFEIQAAADGKNYEALDFVASRNGNASYSQRYAYADKFARNEGLMYYRLKQIDLNGTVAYSQAKVVDLGRFNYSASVYPNPFQDVFKVNLETQTAQTAEVLVTDITGKTLYTTQMSLAKGNNLLDINLSKQTPGLYLLKVTTGNQTYINRLVKQ